MMHGTGCLDVDGIIEGWSNILNQRSAHTIFPRVGGVIQTVPFDRMAWHCPVVNGTHLGWELENAAYFTINDFDKLSGCFVRKVWRKKQYIPLEECIFANHQTMSAKMYWHKFTDAQYDTVRPAIRAAMEFYGWTKDKITEHYKKAATWDLGPAWDWARVL
jgi:N-acetyl-anhydromuramyl-L-alanine amidase AmpD